MLNFEFVVKEETVTSWADERINTLDEMSMQLLRDLAEMFLVNIEEKDYVPVWSGTLLESAMEEDNWQFISGLEANGLLITWSGEDNPNESEWEAFDNKGHEDYALANYKGYHWRTLTPQPKNSWVVKGISDTFANGDGMDIIGEAYLNWLLTGSL